MKRYACILLALLFAGCAASRRSAVATAPQEKQYAVILSMDAFRWDLAGRSHTPTLDSLARVGTYAEIYPVYPSNTFPSHYAMATGLHPDHHGVVNNGFYDRTQGRRLSVFDSLDVRTPGFWGGEPIWNTAERQGLTANIFMWPGSEVPIGGRQATVWTRYSSKPDYYQRADWVIDAMTRPEAEIPQLVMWYFEEPDAAMHTYGPESPEAVGRAEHIDSVLRYFFREIRRSPVFDRINFIVTADHGMAELSPDRYINLLPLLDTAQVVIDRFFVMNREQELLLDGVASRSREDSVTLRLRNFDLAPFMQVAERLGYVVEGRTNGSATMKSVLHAGEISADILLDSLEVNDIPAPPLRLSSRWDFSRNRAGVTVTDRNKRDTLIRGFYAPSQVRYYARLDIDSLDMGLLDPVLSGVISQTEGLASAELVLQGQRRDADLTGRIHVTGLSTKVDFTQVAYSMPEAVLDVRGNRFRASNVPVFDPEGNRGRFDIDLSLQHLSNIAYDVRVAPQQMLVLNTTAQDNDFFYGKVYASGTARISGDKGAVNMDIAASTDDHSSFFMPLSNKSNISYADFVTFKEKPKVDTVDNLARRKMMFERQRQQKTVAGSQMNIALALNVRPGVEVELSVSGNTLKGRGDGTLNLQINPRSNVFEMYGDYTITEGSFLFSLQNIINKKFIIENGSTIQWTGAPMDAMLNIDAIYKLKASLQPLLQGTAENVTADRSVPVECIIHLGDRLSNPAVTFDVNVPGTDPETQAVVANALTTPETVDTQFAYLLLFNSFMSENNAASSNIGASVSAATGLEFLSNMVSNLLSNDDYNIVIRYRPKSELTSDEVDFGLSKSLINNRLFVEVEGNYLIDNKQAINSSMSNFMGEAYITYLIDRAGTLKAKAFTQTIDRFDENQGLQETGVGIYFKEDFDNFRDLRRRIRERFTNKKRKARREARREAARREKELRRAAADTLQAFRYVKHEKDVSAP